MLRKLVPNQLKVLRDFYAENLPSSVPSHQLLTHFIQRFEKVPKWQEKVHFLAPKNSNLTKDGTFMFVDGEKVHFDTMEEPPHLETVKMLSNFDFGERKIFFGIRNSHRQIILDDLMRILNLEKIFDHGVRFVALSKFEKLKVELFQE